ncbi:hypothetical protein MASR2M78_20480 [Treponema sp.]
MKKIIAVLLTLFAISQFISAQTKKTVLYIYDEPSKEAQAFISYFKDAFAKNSIVFDESSAADMATKDLGSYDDIVIHSMVMAFNMKSPLRDWLKTSPKLQGKKVRLLVTANRWFLDKLFSQQQNLLNENGADIVDAVSAATKDMDSVQKAAKVEDFVAALK